jgi:hypothetical protein
MDPYFAGLIDTDGSIVFNYPSNRIECTRTQVQSIFWKLVLDFVIPYYKPSLCPIEKKPKESISIHCV